jgi:hypothetical protein
MSVAELPQTAAPRAADPTPVRWRIGWIVGPGTDIPWFILGALGGYALFFLHMLIQSGYLREQGLTFTMAEVWLAWYVLLDVPHFFGTYARTYLDREELSRRKRLLFGSLAFPLIGPALILLSFGFYAAGVERYALPFELLFVFVSLWAYWHVVRQHYGILALYKRKNDDVAPLDQWVDKSLLYVGLIAPFAAMVVRHQTARAEVFLPAGEPQPGAWDWWLVQASIALLGVATLAFTARQIQRYCRGEAINVPKLLFLLAVVPLHAFVCYHPAVLDAPLYAFAAFVTIFHDIQYHAIVWHYQRNRIHRPGVDKKRFGLAAVVSRNIIVFFGCALALGVGSWALGCVIKVEIGCMNWVPTVIASDAIPLFGQITMQHVFMGMAMGFIMHHYFVDQFIWKTGRSEELQNDLKLTA